MTLPDAPGAPPPRIADTGVGVLDRSVAILDAVERGARTLAEVVGATGLSRTTAHRLLQALERHALLSHERGSGYRLGPHLARLAAGSERGMPWPALARGPLERLAAATGESAQLYVREADVRVCVEAVESANELRTSVPVGARLPLNAGSAGKVFLAWSSVADRERLVAGARALTRRTPVGAKLERELDAVRARGWASSAGEREDGVGSVSVPVRGPGSDAPLAVISISGPISRVGGSGPPPHLEAVRAASREIEAILAT
jgi:DNA-binding IclR family transcriptional regulator